MSLISPAVRDCLPQTQRPLMKRRPFVSLGTEARRNGAWGGKLVQWCPAPQALVLPSCPTWSSCFEESGNQRPMKSCTCPCKYPPVASVPPHLAQDTAGVRTGRPSAEVIFNWGSEEQVGVFWLQKTPHPEPSITANCQIRKGAWPGCRT